ncbi:SulP family inorganic anion transporter [Pseudoteredinibacter isoporae]|uniref:SulP family sulfate permease n=1 Tax=Pseudoteredinibacter isoporae TaxID=570281 RepID=A0A7X0JXQ2_9GAMM|nr:sulfate permease [Pseudoteredinibacter isoporae]MBB6523346.1 SulP family sulfate permease [Pseudoteredinibacter isoporae]NHO88859.1 sulfate permease [Pseudoteredinibacter isoporae]NIB24433.1 sulfate permease [Pseudoteredinibacter isoporae]
MQTKLWPSLLPWRKDYHKSDIPADGLAAVIVTILLIPQSLAYAMLAGLPPQMGLYASILPLLAYALFGSSRVLAVGPVAIISLLTASTISQYSGNEAIQAAMMLAALSGGMLFTMGVLKLGWLASLLSQAVMTGFIIGSALLIALSQLKHILAIPFSGHNLPEMFSSFLQHQYAFNDLTLWVGLGSLILLILSRRFGSALLKQLGLSEKTSNLLGKAGPIVAVVVAILVVRFFKLDTMGLSIVADIPGGLPALQLPTTHWQMAQDLLPAAFMISLIGFVESVSVAQSLAAKRRQRIEPDQEFLGLGAANVAAACSGGYPVTGGFARSVVSFDAGAVSPMTGIFTAIGISITCLFLTPLFYYLPHATLAATIIVAVSSLLEWHALRDTWRFSKIDFIALLTTLLLVLLQGVEAGIFAGVGISLALHLWKTSRPHIAEVGLMPGTQHFRNKDRHNVICSGAVLSARVDESLYFANIRYLEDKLYAEAISREGIEHVVLMCSAINSIDYSALEGLESLNLRLKHAGIQFHLSEVKGPVMDQLKRSRFLEDLSGQVFLSQYQAFNQLCNELDATLTPRI